MKYIGKKITALIITLFIVSISTFLAFQVIPGDSISASMGMEGTKEDMEQVRKELGMDKNLAVRYGKWLGGAVKGDFGQSSQFKLPVRQLIGQRLQVTAGLAVLSVILIIVVSIPLGILCSRWRGKFIDKFVSVFCQITMAVPPFFMGILLTLVFGVVIKLFTPGKYVSMEESFFGYLQYMIFPAVAIAVPKVAMVVKILRSSLLRQLDMDYVRTARSKGNTENRILYKHVLKNALIPVITFLAMIFVAVLAESIIVEQVFSLPGLGRLLVTAISNRDFLVVQAIVLYIAAIVVILNFAVDILYQYIDPRVRV